MGGGRDFRGRMANTPWPLKGNKVQHQALLDCDGAVPVLPLQLMTAVVLYFVGLPLPLDQLARLFLTSAVGIKVNGGRVTVNA